MTKTLVLIAAVVALVLIAIAGAYMAVLVFSVGPNDTTRNDDDQSGGFESRPWFMGAGPDGAVVYAVSPRQGEGGAASGFTAEGEEEWTAADVFDGAAVQPPAALLITTPPAGGSRVVLITAKGRRVGIREAGRPEGTGGSTIFRAIGVIGRRGWYAWVSPGTACMRCVGGRGEVLSTVSLGEIDNIISAGASADGRRLALLTESYDSGSAPESELLWVRCDRRGQLSIAGRVSVDGSFMVLSRDGGAAMTGDDGRGGILIMPFGARRGVRLAAPFLSDGAVGRERALVVTRQVVDGQPTTRATVIDIVSGRRLWTMTGGDQWLVHADSRLRLVTVVDPTSCECEVVDVKSGTSTRLPGEHVDAWPVSDNRVATLSVTGKVVWRSIAVAK